ncbi:MAG: hypothetical protein JWN61_469 [Pseudonocardiales bacterium]|nr:hypothetical protein [Pseudonocardiales bacterium]
MAPEGSAVPRAVAPAPGAASAGPVTDEVRALLAHLADRPVAEHAEVFADIHGVLQNALSDAGRDPAPR